MLQQALNACRYLNQIKIIVLQSIIIMLKSGKGKARLRPPASKTKKPPIPVPQ